MPRTRTTYSGEARGLAENHRNHTELQLNQKQAIELLRHVAEAISYERGVVIDVHFGRRTRRTGNTVTNLVRVKTPPVQ